MLSLLLICGGVLSCYNTVPVYAADALSAEAGTEMLMVLWNLLMNAMVVSGAADAALDYDSEKDLFTAFTDCLTRDMSEVAWWDDNYVKIDGQVVYMGDVLYTVTDGTGALNIPDEETWKKFRVVNGGSSGDSENSGEDQEPDSPFTKVESMKIGNDFLAYVGAWIADLWSGLVEGVDAADYYYVDAEGLPDYSFSGSNQVYNCRFYWADYSSTGVFIEQYGTITSEYPIIFYFDGSGYREQVYVDGDFYNSSRYGDLIVSQINNGVIYSENWRATTTWALSMSVDSVAYSTTAPMFNSKEAALAYLQNGDTSGIINADPYSYPALADTVPKVLNPYADAVIDPAALLSLYAALVAAAEAVPEPEPGTDTAANNNAYAAAMTEAVAIPDALPDTDTDTDTDADAGLVIDPAAEVTLDTYKIEVTNIFPFCLPFDLIHLLEVLDAEPEAPVFEFPFVVPGLAIDMVVKLDLSWLDPVMEIWRLGEVVGFVILLIFATGKLIKW